MKIKTKFFGEIDIDDEQIILFPYGIYGFEEYTRFVLLHDIDEDENETKVIRFLQCADEENLCFTVVDPKFVESAYSPKLPANYAKRIGISSDADLIYLVIAVISDNIEESTVNMQGPIVINSKNRVGAQIILETSEPENAKYKIKHEVFKTQEDFAKC